MKKSILILIALTMLSCGYSIKSDSEIATEMYQIELAQDELNKAKEQWKQLKDSVALLVIKEERYKDSLQFINLTRTMCYDKNEHRHSCEIYK